MKTGLEVFDFNEEDEPPVKFCCKFKNPSLDNPAILKRELLEPAAQGVVIVKKERRTDANEGDNAYNTSNNGAAPSSFKIVRENPATQDTTADQGAAWQSQSPTHENVPCSNMDTFESESSFTEVEAKFLCDEAPSPEKCQSTCALVGSPLNSEPVNVKSDADGSDESSPRSSISNIAEDDGTVDDRSSDSFFSAPETDGISIAVDYVSYGDNYCTGCMVIFSCDGIKISGVPAYGEQENFCFEREIDDIIRIESQQIQRSGVVTVKLHFLPKDAALANGVELLEFALMQPNWSGKFEEVTSLHDKYLAVSSIMRDTDFFMDDGADIILRRRSYFPIFDDAVEDVVYPKGDSDAVSISKRDFDLLQPETFVNDTIIDFYIKYLKNQIPPEERHKFHFFNSFFFRKLADLDKDPSSVSDGRAAFLRVHKWTRKVDIFGKDYIFIPVNFSLHWSLLVICHPGEVAGFKDEDLGKSLRVPCILHMDSIKGTHAGLKNLVQSYLWEEWKSRQKDTSDYLSAKFLNLRFVPLELPQQENSFDCGLFLLHYLELFLAEAPPNFSPFRINKSSKFLTADWFPPAEASLKRTLIQRLISALLDNHTRELSFSKCSDEPESCFPHNNMKETAVQLVSERCTSAVACHGKVSSSDANQGIEITLLESSLRNVDCVSDSLVLRDLFEPGAASGSLLAQCTPFDEPSYYHHNGIMSQQIEEDEENVEPFGYFPCGDAIFQQTGGMAPQSSSISYSLRGYGAQPCWEKGENDALSPETSACASDDSDVGIIENFPVEKIQDLCQIDGVDNLASQSTEQINDELNSSVMNITEEVSMVCDEKGNANISFCGEDVAAIHTSFEMVENGLHQQSEADMNIERVGGDLAAERELVMVESDEKQIMVRITMADSDEKQSNDSNESEKRMIVEEGTVVSESDKKQPNETIQGSFVAESNQKQSNEKHTIETDLMAESDAIHEKHTIQDNNNMESQEDCKMVELDKKHRMEDSDSNEMGTKQDSNLVGESDEHQPTKRQRVTPTDEGSLFLM